MKKRRNHNPARMDLTRKMMSLKVITLSRKGRFDDLRRYIQEVRSYIFHLNPGPYGCCNFCSRFERT